MKKIIIGVLLGFLFFGVAHEINEELSYQSDSSFEQSFFETLDKDSELSIEHIGYGDYQINGDVVSGCALSCENCIANYSPSFRVHYGQWWRPNSVKVKSRSLDKETLKLLIACTKELQAKRWPCEPGLGQL